MNRPAHRQVAGVRARPAPAEPGAIPTRATGAD
jgi:hypothetical protein